MSKPQVTITLGRSGQVVKKSGSGADNSHSDHRPPAQSSGSKRSIKDRLGNVGDKSNGSQPKSKRQRRDGNKRNATSDDPDGVRVNPNDLRYKLMRKNPSRRAWSDGEEQQSKRDLREKLSSTIQPPMRPRQQISDTRRQHLPDTRQHTSDNRRQHLPDTRQHIGDARQHMSETKDTGLLRRIPPSRSDDDLLHMDSYRKSYSAWNLTGVRRRSPDRVLGTSRGLSPPRAMDSLRTVASIRPVDATRPPLYMSKDIIDASRHTSSFMGKTSVPLEAGKPGVLPLPNAPGTTQKISYMGEEPLTVANLLHSLGLGKYAILFQAEEVDMTALKQMGDHDLKELGIPMGPRKKILLAVSSHSKRPPRDIKENNLKTMVIQSNKGHTNA